MAKQRDLSTATTTITGPPLRTPSITGSVSPCAPSSSGRRRQDSYSYEPVNLNQDLMHFADPDPLLPQRPCTYLTRTGVVHSQPSSPDPEAIAEGVEVLNHLLDLIAEIGPILEDPESVTDVFTAGLLGRVVWETTGATLRGLQSDRSASNLADVSRAMFEQTSQTPVFPPSAGGGALEAMFSTKNLRWEVLGIYCALLGVYLGGEKDKQISFGAHKKWKSDRKTLMLQAYQACIRCELFCDRVGAVNDLMLWFSLIYMVFVTWVLGDDSYHVFRIVGNLTSVYLALDLHSGSHVDSRTPFYLVELRRRAIAWAQEHDKVSATFTSRPPRLSRHFCTLDLPLDVADNVLMGSHEDFEAARLQLDENGWSKSNERHSVIRQRLGLLLAPIREEALELKNGRSRPFVEAEARRLLLKSASTWEAVPSRLRYTASHENAPIRDQLVYLPILRLEWLFTDFLLYSVLVNAGESDRRKLITTAHQIVTLFLLPTRKNHLLETRRSDNEFNLVFYAMPCASVLVLELMRQDQNPSAPPIPNRSGIIQDMSMLISCCESLTEIGQNNYQICKQAQLIFSRSLDSILNQSEPSSEPLLNSKPVEPETPGQCAFLDNGIIGDSAQELPLDWNLWLESVGLRPDPWLDSIMQPMDFTMDQGV